MIYKNISNINIRYNIWTLVDKTLEIYTYLEVGEVGYVGFLETSLTADDSVHLVVSSLHDGRVLQHFC